MARCGKAKSSGAAVKFLEISRDPSKQLHAAAIAAICDTAVMRKRTIRVRNTRAQRHAAAVPRDSPLA
jgi:hypothetical protein